MSESRPQYGVRYGNGDIYWGWDYYSGAFAQADLHNNRNRERHAATDDAVVIVRTATYSDWVVDNR